MNKRKPITSAAQFFRVAKKYKDKVRYAVIDRGYREAEGHLGLSTHLYECYRIWVTADACRELIDHFIKIEKERENGRSSLSRY